MKTHLLAIYDSLSGFTTGITKSGSDIDVFVEELNREFMTHPAPNVKDLVVFHLGDFDDETLTLEPLVAARQVGDCSKAYKFLKAEQEKYDAIREAKEKAKGVQDAPNN